MELINARKKLKAEHFKQLFSMSDSDEVLFFDDSGAIATVTTKANAIDDIFKRETPTEDSTELSVSCGDVCLQFLGIDFRWYADSDKKKANMKKKVYDEQREEAPKKAAVEPMLERAFYHVATTYDADDGDPVTEDFKGTKAECLDWLNKQIVRHRQSNGDILMLFCLDIDDPDYEWKTLEELFDSGEIEVKAD